MPTAALLSTFTTGLVAGAFFMGTFGIRPAAAALDPGPHVVLRQQLILRLSRIMPALMLSAIVTTAAAVYFCAPSQDIAGIFAKESIPRIGAFALSLIMLLQTIIINSPINDKFLGWTAETLPSDWRNYVRRWDGADSRRMVMAVFAFALTLIPVS